MALKDRPLDRGRGGEERSQAYLELPPEHPLNLLWSLWAQCPGPEPPRPKLCLEEVLPRPGDPQTPLLTAAGAHRELSRLERQAAGAAQGRLAQLKPAEDGTPPDLDAEVQVYLTADCMTAWVLCCPPSGEGAGVSRDLLAAALERAGVRRGIEEGLLDGLPQSPERYLRLFLAARGTPVVHGKDGRIIDLFVREPKRTLEEDEDGRVDYASVSIFQNARKGDVICQIIAPVPGRNGWTVLDQEVPARPGKPAFVPKGQNTELSGDGNSLIASCEGHVEFSGKYFLVKPVLEISGNVDFSTGNIDCFGDIHVRGDVRAGFTVHATGSITIDGVVEGGCVEAGGDIIVRNGVRGSGKAVLRAQRSIFIRYLECGNIYAHQNLEAECIVNSRVCCDGSVRARSGKGAIIGGEVRAGREVSAKSIGTQAEPLTCLILGGRPFEESQRKELEREIAELEGQLEKIERQPDSPTKLRRMAKARVRISANRMKLQKFDKELERAAGEEKRVRGQMVCGIVYPGVEITSGAYFLRVSHETRKCVTAVSGGELTLIADH